MSNKKCYLCDSTRLINRKGSVRDNSVLDILECIECGLVFLSDFSHINDKHYENSGMHDGMSPEVDSWLKETEFDDERRFQFLRSKITNKSVIDFGCGAGGFIKKSKNVSSRISGIELEQAMQASYKERELDVYNCIDAALADAKKWDFVTAFHVVEHLPDPISVLRDLSKLLAVNGEIIIEVPNSDDALLTLYQNESFQNFTYWSQHLFLFNVHTLNKTLKQAGLNVSWVRQVQRYPLSNHLYWLSQSKAGGHKAWSFLDNEILNTLYEKQLASIGKCDTIIAGAIPG